MSTNAVLADASLRIAGCYQSNRNELNSNLLSVATGKRVNSPQDDAVDYFRIGRMNTTLSGITRVQQGISAGTSMLKVAEAAGTSVFNDLADMQSLLRDYYDPGTTDDEKAVDVIKFNTIAGRISDTISGTYYDGKKLIADSSRNPLMKVSVGADDPSQTYDISYTGNDVVDVSGLTLGQAGKDSESAALQAQYERATGYLSKTATYSGSMSSFYALSNNQKENLQQTITNEQSIDMGEAMATITKQQVCQQGALAMLSQANMVQQNMLSLVLKL
jgi:flagellin